MSTDLSPSYADLPLRDIHLPEAVAWWPIAPGWWMLLAGLILLGLLLLLWRRYRRRRQVRRAAWRSLKEIERNFREQGDKQQLLANLSILLRRLALSHASRTESAAVVGDQWLSLLDKVHQEMPYSRGIGYLLAQGPYQRQCDYDARQLLNLVRKTVKRWPLPGQPL
ncbi:MAG: DUF4381 domain-containing protein [Gammaproteobacteria bacterium]|nr:DUF4381 domain-containing protein [Gammaproteobacteria bacterium]